MPCKCPERKEELRAKGVKPLLGEDYTPVDAARWAIMKAFEKVSE